MLFDKAKILLQDTDFQLIIVNVENSYGSHKTNFFPDTSTSSFLEHIIWDQLSLPGNGDFENMIKFKGHETVTVQVSAAEYSEYLYLESIYSPQKRPV